MDTNNFQYDLPNYFGNVLGVMVLSTCVFCRDATSLIDPNWAGSNRSVSNLTNNLIPSFSFKYQSEYRLKMDNKLKIIKN